MPTTIIGPQAQEFPTRAVPVIVEIKRAWGDDWKLVPELEFVRANAATAGHDLDSLELVHRYGLLKHPWETEAGQRRPADLLDCWVRVRFAGDQGMQQAWIGRISGEGRNVFGCVDGPAGVQRFEAFGPLQLLRKIHVSKSYWSVGDGEQEIAWVPPLNERHGRTDQHGQATGTLDKRLTALGARSGNRSNDWSLQDVHLYGGSELWTYWQYAEYLLRRFVDERDTGGPMWQLGGHCTVLGEFTDPIVWGATQTVDQMLRKLINPDLGVDFKIVSTESGFVVSVFSLSKEASAWADYKIPGNPDLVKIRSSRTTDAVQTTVAKTAAQRYGKIRMLGGRIVVCGSLKAHLSPPTLVYKWRPADETEYVRQTANPSADAETCDKARQAERFWAVFRRYAAPPDWDFGGGDFAPQWDGQGKVIETPGGFQRKSRSTLPWLPLATGVDYSQQPAVDRNAAGATPELRAPQAWLYYTSTGGGKWEPADGEGIGVSVLPDDLGVFLHASPNHLLAKDLWDAWTDKAPSQWEPTWHSRRLIVTLAWLSDQRIICEQAIEDAAPSDGVLEIDASDCQCWYLAPYTMLDVDGGGQPIQSPGEGQVLRNDWPRLAARMSAAVARHYQERARAQIVVRGLWPWGKLLGQILTVIDEGGETQTIEAPITSIAWTNGEHPTTTISTGFAHSD